MTTPLRIRFSTMPSLGIVTGFTPAKTAREARDFVARQNKSTAEKRARLVAEEKARVGKIIRRREEVARAHQPLARTKPARLNPSAIFAERNARAGQRGA